MLSRDNNNHLLRNVFGNRFELSRRNRIPPTKWFLFFFFFRQKNPTLATGVPGRGFSQMHNSLINHKKTFTIRVSTWI